MNCRLGFLIDFLSHAAVVGFMGGAAITIALQQLKGFLGIKKFTKKTDIIAVLDSVFSAAHHGVRILLLFLDSYIVKNVSLNHINMAMQWNWQTILIGASFLTFLLTSKLIVRNYIYLLNYQIVYSFLYESDISWLGYGTGEKEQETVLGSGGCTVDISYHFHLLCLHNPSRQTRSPNCKNSLNLSIYLRHKLFAFVLTCFPF